MWTNRQAKTRDFFNNQENNTFFDRFLGELWVGLVYCGEIRMGPGPLNVTDSPSGGPRGLPHYNVRGVSNSMGKTSGDK